MKSKIINKEPIEACHPSFPLLARMIDEESSNYGIVVLFSSHNSGTVVYAPFSSRDGIGFYSNDWTDVFYHDVWEILDSKTTIQLSNETELLITQR